MKLCDEAGEKFGGPSKFNLIGFFGPPCMRKEPRSLTDENNNQMPYNLLFFYGGTVLVIKNFPLVRNWAN